MRRGRRRAWPAPGPVRGHGHDDGDGRRGLASSAALTRTRANGHEVAGRCGDRRCGVARRLRGDDCRAFPHGRARRVCIIAVRLPPVAVYSSLTPAVFGLDPGGSGPFSWVRQGASRLSPPSCRPGLSAGRAAGRLFVCRRWPAAADQVGRHRRPHHRQSWSAEKSTLQNGLQAVFSPSPGPGATRQPENAA